ncbi:hypothetical protein A0256_23920 [Mucilaginibacter sp. PAMC 26640]|nr:hypothetical protein A0256_23920 [Mucilaginibacter sp. PAMC 26640]
MKQQEVFKKIGVIIQEINEQYEYLQGTAENLNDLELELFVANTHFLKDHGEILRKLNAIKSQPITKSSIKDEPKWFEPVVQPAKPVAAPFKPEPAKPANNEQIKFEIIKSEDVAPVVEPAASIDLSSDTSDGSYSFEREEPEAIRHELVLDEADTFEDEGETPSQDEILLTPVAEIETKEKATEEEAEQLDEVDAKTEVVKYRKEQTAPELQIIVLPESEKANEPISWQPAKDVTKNAVAESMEDIQVDNLKAYVTEEQTIVALPAHQDSPAIEEDDKVLTLNQRLSAQRKEQAVKPTEAIEPLADIKSAINLNDKLLFVKDLFKGYNLAYTEAIEIVNRFSTFEEADRFLKNNYVTKNNWEAKKETSDKFYALLKRRYA